jgi:hypothetical protein
MPLARPSTGTKVPARTLQGWLRQSQIASLFSQVAGRTSVFDTSPGPEGRVPWLRSIFGRSYVYPKHRQLTVKRFTLSVSASWCGITPSQQVA